MERDRFSFPPPLVFLAATKKKGHSSSSSLDECVSFSPLSITMSFFLPQASSIPLFGFSPPVSPQIYVGSSVMSPLFILPLPCGQQEHRLLLVFFLFDAG